MFPICKDEKNSQLFPGQIVELGSLREKASQLTQYDPESEASSDADTDGDEDDNGFPDNVAKVALESIQIHVSCLMELLPSMENTLHHADSSDPSETTKARAASEFQVSAPASNYIMNVRDRFTNADSRLIKRLGEANWPRHVALRRNAEQKDSTTVIDHTSDAIAPELPKSVFVPVSMFHDSALGSSVPTQSTYAITMASHSSFLSSLEDTDIAGLRVPSLPKEARNGMPFTCKICNHELRRIKNRVDWK